MLTTVFGARLFFPSDFVGRGDMKHEWRRPVGAETLTATAKAAWLDRRQHERE
jgi:hypothetical protein